MTQDFAMGFLMIMWMISFALLAFFPTKWKPTSEWINGWATMTDKTYLFKFILPLIIFVMSFIPLLIIN